MRLLLWNLFPLKFTEEKCEHELKKDFSDVPLKKKLETHCITFYFESSGKALFQVKITCIHSPDTLGVIAIYPRIYNFSRQTSQGPDLATPYLLRHLRLADLTT